MKKILFTDFVNFKTEEFAVSVGSVSYKREAITLCSGEKLYFELEVEKDDLILEIEELHRKTDSVFSYSVECDNQAIYFRSYEPCADALNGCFIHLPESAQGKKINLTINVEYGKVHLSAAYLHSNEIFENCEEMLAGFFTPPFKADNMQVTIDAVNELKRTVTKESQMLPTAAFEIPYMNRTDREITDLVNYWLNVALKTETPLFINLNTWWGGTPGGPDGKGGHFTDAEYQQISFNPETEKYSLTVPNMWSNTPWLTMNNPVLNNARKHRLAAVVRLLQRLIAKFFLDNKPFNVRIFLDNEPAYWAAFAYGGDADSGGDFSAFLLDDAKKDGVKFKKGESLEDYHRKWLLKNMNRYIDSLAKVCNEQLNHEPIIYKNGKQINFNSYISQNVYTHVFPFACYPYMNPQNPQWETHVTPYAKLGIESSTVEDSRILDYAVRVGSFANINSERACMHDYSVFLQDYSYGADACMIFNYRKGDANEVNAEGIKFHNSLISERDFPVPVETVDVFKEGLSNSSVIEFENMNVYSYRNRRVFRPENIGIGKILFNVGKAKQYGELLTVELWHFCHSKTGGIKLSVGKSKTDFKAYSYLSEHSNEGSPVTVDISLEGFDREDDVFVLLEIEAKTFEADWCELNYIWFMRFMRRHSMRAGHINGYKFTALQNRSLNRMLAKRADENKNFAYKFSDTYLIEGSGFIREEIECIAEYPVFIKTTENDSGLILSVIGESKGSITLKKSSATEIALNSWKIEKSNTDCVLEIKTKIFEKNIIGNYCGTVNGLVRISNHKCLERDWQPCEEIPLCDGAVIRLKNGDLDFVETEIINIPKGADVYAECSENGIISADFTVNILTGTVEDYKAVTLYPETKNATLIIKNKNEIYTFSIGRECLLNYEGAPHQSICGCPEGDPKFKNGSKVTVKYSNSGLADAIPRALEIKQI